MGHLAVARKASLPRARASAPWRASTHLGETATRAREAPSAGEWGQPHIQRNGATTEERIYLGGWELYRKRSSGAIEVERETLHVMDDTRRIAMVETLTWDAGDELSSPLPRIRYQYGNHLDSAMLECDDDGDVISYEEYHPYGTSAYRSAKSGVEVSVQRYRYTGKERDEETGLNYHQWRYYAPWLARWTATDPAGIVDGVVLYNYVTGSPVIFQDPRGLEIYLEGLTEADRTKALELLQKLTNDKLSIETITTKTGGGAGCFPSPPETTTTRYKVVSKGQQEKPDLIKGTQLLRDLMKSKHDVLIKQGPDVAEKHSGEGLRDPKGVAGKGSGTTIGFDFKKTEADRVWVDDTVTGERKWERGERHIDLGHELIHAERFARGVGLTTAEVENPDHPMVGKKSDGGRSYVTSERPDELETIGTVGHNSRITENDLRAEHRMNFRLSHATRK